MVSRLARRSGVAVVQIAELLNWRPEIVFHVGVGLEHAEVTIMKDEVWNASGEHPAVRFVGFEPHPKTFATVHQTYPGTLHNLALGDQDCDSAPFYELNHHRDGSSLLVRPEQTEPTYFVRVAKLDTLYPVGSGAERTLLWIDAEGNELAVLNGAEKFIEHVEVINIELTGKTIPGWSDQSSVHRWLMDHGFLRQWVHTQRIHVGQQDCIYVRRAIFNPEICPCPCQLNGSDVYSSAIRKHRDQRGDDRCWMDDEELYRVLPEGYNPPARDTAVELKNCERFIACRNNPATEYISPEREIERLNTELSAYKRLVQEIVDTCGGTVDVEAWIADLKTLENNPCLASTNKLSD